MGGLPPPLLLGPAEGPEGREVSGGCSGEAGGADGAGPQQQGSIQFVKGLAGDRGEVLDRRGEERFLVGPADRAVAVGAVAQVGEVAEEGLQVGWGRAVVIRY